MGTLPKMIIVGGLAGLVFVAIAARMQMGRQLLNLPS